MLKYLKKFMQVSVAAMLLTMVALPSSVSAQDCDANAIIRCGVTSQSNLQQKYAQNQANNVQQIYHEFSIPSADALNGLVAGQVTKDNRVIVNGVVVATNAYTAGRQRLSSTDVSIAGGAAYKRHPSVSFRSNSLPALVKMDGSRFVFAVIYTCGNPVVATPNTPPPVTPPPVEVNTPQIEALKQVRKLGDTAWTTTIAAKPGDAVQYRLLVSNTGNVVLNNVTLRDNLPVGFTSSGIVSGTTSQMSGDLFGQGLNIGTLLIGQEKEIIFGTIIKADTEACNPPALNVFIVKADSLPEKQATANVSICKETKQVVQTVVVKNVPTPPPAQPVANILPNTGSANVIGIFIGTSVIGTLAYRYILGRKFDS